MTRIHHGCGGQVLLYDGDAECLLCRRRGYFIWVGDTELGQAYRLFTREETGTGREIWLNSK